MVDGGGVGDGAGLGEGLGVGDGAGEGVGGGVVPPLVCAGVAGVARTVVVPVCPIG